MLPSPTALPAAASTKPKEPLNVPRFLLLFILGAKLLKKMKNEE
jgi:hypothetical protein